MYRRISHGWLGYLLNIGSYWYEFEFGLVRISFVSFHSLILLFYISSSPPVVGLRGIALHSTFRWQV